MANEIQEFNELLGRRIKELTDIQTTYVVAKNINWQDRTMIGIGQLDDLEYPDILLGLGGEYKKPKAGSICLIGIINNNPANTFLITAEKLEELHFTSADTVVTIKENGIVLNRNNENLQQVLNDMIDELNKIVVINGTTINVMAMNKIKQRLNTILI